LDWSYVLGINLIIIVLIIELFIYFDLEADLLCVPVPLSHGDPVKVVELVGGKWGVLLVVGCVFQVKGVWGFGSVCEISSSVDEVGVGFAVRVVRVW